MNIQFFDNKVSSVVQNDTFGYAKNAIFRLGWEDSLEPEKYTLNSHSGWTLDNVKTAGLWDPIQECIQECEFFPSHYVVDRIVVNLVRPCDVHYIHHHKNGKMGGMVKHYFMNHMIWIMFALQVLINLVE